MGRVLNPFLMSIVAPGFPWIAHEFELGLAELATPYRCPIRLLGDRNPTAADNDVVASPKLPAMDSLIALHMIYKEFFDSIPRNPERGKDSARHVDGMQ